MPVSDNVLLITGTPGIGKTTVIKKVLQRFSRLTVAGFYTEEIRVNKVRQGFDLVTFRNERFTMAHSAIRSGHRVGKYGVAVDIIDKVVAATLNTDDAPKLYIIDEIGKMECFSTLFVRKVTSLLDCRRPVVATIALKGGGFIAEVKNRPGAALWEVTKKNRNEMPAKIDAWLHERFSGRSRRI
jgi:nucleoside-triphosphatase